MLGSWCKRLTNARPQWVTLCQPCVTVLYQHDATDRALTGIKAARGCRRSLHSIMHVLAGRPMAHPSVPHADALRSAFARDRDHASILERARSLLGTARAGRSTQALKDKRVGLVCRSEDQDAALLRQAAMDLGAHVSDIRPCLTAESGAEEVAATAKMLSRLYDVVVLQGQPTGVAERLADVSGVPVLNDIASASHSTALLAEEVDPATVSSEGRRYVIQAVLLEALT